MNPSAVYAVDLAIRSLGQRDSITALDMCAAPGGKTFRLKSHGASVVSMDVSNHDFLDWKKMLDVLVWMFRL